MKKYLLIALALIGANAFMTPAQADNTCPHLWITNASGSPPVVQGGTVNISASGISPAIDIYYDGSYSVSIYDILDPPGYFFASGAQFVNVPVGAHTLRNGIESCTVNFSVVPIPTNPTMTQGWTSWQEGSDIYTTVTTLMGFQQGAFGSMSPTTTDNSKPYQALFDRHVCSIFGCSLDSTLVIGGWSSNPGQAWLNSISAVGNTKTGAAASYSYSGGVATWSWYGENFGFSGSGSTVITVSHN